MPIVKTADLIGPALDWAVAKCEGRSEVKIYRASRPTDRGWIEVRFNPEPRAATARFDPSESWVQGGPIMEKMKIGLSYFKGDTLDKRPFVVAAISTDYGPEGSLWMAGPTPLVAAMRCYCCSKLGEEIEIPDELAKDTE